MNLFSKEKINPMIGAAGISAFPMAARVVQKMALKEDPSNVLIMQATGTKRIRSDRFCCCRWSYPECRCKYSVRERRYLYEF